MMMDRSRTVALCAAIMALGALASAPPASARVFFGFAPPVYYPPAYYPPPIYYPPPAYYPPPPVYCTRPRHLPTRRPPTSRHRAAWRQPATPAHSCVRCSRE